MLCIPGTRLDCPGRQFSPYWDGNEAGSVFVANRDERPRRAAELHGWANHLIPKLLLPFVASGPTDWSADIFGLAFWIWFFIAWAGLYLALEYSFDAREEAQRSSELKTLAHHAKLSALHNQINPHFLFDSLNSISALILDQRLQDAEAMVSRLAGFLRMTLVVDPSRISRCRRRSRCSRCISISSGLATPTSTSKSHCRSTFPGGGACAHPAAAGGECGEARRSGFGLADENHHIGCASGQPAGRGRS